MNRLQRAARPGMGGVPIAVLRLTAAAALCAAASGAASGLVSPGASASVVLRDVYPDLAAGALTHARLAELPSGVVLRSADVAVTETDLSAFGADAPPSVRAQLKRHPFFVLEQVAAGRLLAAEAAREWARAGRAAPKEGDRDPTETYVRGLLDAVTVADTDVVSFYRENTAMFGGAPLETVRRDLTRYLLQRKQRERFLSLIESLGLGMPVAVSAGWAKSRAAVARDNPVDKARAGGIPSMVDFGQEGCGPCDMMAPILGTLKKKYEGRANILFVHVGEEQILAARFGIESIPVQIFFDRSGRETSRHTGFLAQPEIEKRLADMGVK